MRLAVEFQQSERTFTLRNVKLFPQEPGTARFLDVLLERHDRPVSFAVEHLHAPVVGVTHEQRVLQVHLTQTRRQQLARSSVKTFASTTTYDVTIHVGDVDDCVVEAADVDEDVGDLHMYSRTMRSCITLRLNPVMTVDLDITWIVVYPSHGSVMRRATSHLSSVGS